MKGRCKFTGCGTILNSLLVQIEIGEENVAHRLLGFMLTHSQAES